MATATVPRETIVAGPGQSVLDIQLSAIDVVDNVRADVGDVTELADSIQHVGILQPIRVRAAGGRYELVFGHRRLAAARKLRLTSIPALVDDDVAPTSGQRATTQLIENIQRADLNAVEEARALRAILDADPQLTQAELGRRIGRSAPYISNQLRILDLDPKVLPMVEAGHLTGAHAKALAGLKGAAQRDMATTAAQRGWSAHELEDRVKWERQHADAEARRAAELASWAKKAEKTLVDKGADKATTTLTTTQYDYGRSDVLVAFNKLGWKTVATSYTRGPAKLCDCRAMGVSKTWEGTLQVTKRCIVKAHDDARRKATVTSSRSIDNWKERQAEEKRRRAQFEAIKKATADQFTAAFAALPPNIGRLLLWSVMDYEINDWVKEHKGDRKKPDAWGELLEQDSQALADAVVRHVFRRFGDRYNVKLDPEAIAEAFGVTLPAPKGAKKAATS